MLCRFRLSQPKPVVYYVPVKLTYHYRIKSYNGFLNGLARKVNFVWNYCNDVQRQAVKSSRKWLSEFDLNGLTAGSSKELGLCSESIQAIARQYTQSRSQFKKPWLRWRSRKVLGWIPLKALSLKYRDGNFVYMGHTFRVFLDRPLPKEAKILHGSNFSQDTLDRWYLNVAVELPTPTKRPGSKSVGLDLGLKDFAVTSDGVKVENPRTLSKYARKLAIAQRANKKKQAAKVHQKTKNTRKDFHHKLSNELTKEYNNIYVGDVSSKALAKTNLAKSVLDVGWSSFRAMLKYKSIRNGSNYAEVDESYTTQTCHGCGNRTGPKGLTGLNEREWVCDCGLHHDRDVNSAINILKRGLVHQALVEGAGSF
jgi:putative transposase